MKSISYIIIVVLLTGCATGKSVSNIKKELTIQKDLLHTLNLKVDSIDLKRITKAEAGEIDEQTDSVTKVYVNRLKDSITERLNYYNTLVSNKRIRKNKKKAIAYMAIVKDMYSTELSNIVFLDDLFNAPTFSRLNTAAFFAPGMYNLTDSTTSQTSFIMENIIRQALGFSSKHPDKKLKAMFIVLGYADEQDINSESDLYTDLSSSIQSGETDRKHLNYELSNKRASSIKNILKSEYEIISPSYNPVSLSSSFIATGKGEILPPGSIKDYQPVDERRRVVLLYWSILPELN